MDITMFDFELPPKCIAQEPLEKREDCKLMVLDKKNGVIKHKKFFQIIELLNPGDLLVLNDSKVVPARLFGYKKESGGKIEVLLINPASDNCWQALLKPGRKAPPGTEIVFSEQLSAIVLNKDEEQGAFLLEMKAEGDIQEILHRVGNIPTPPYIKKNLKNPDSYQTVYARNEGSIAAPTAGIHFTEELLAKIKKKGIDIIYLTLHIGRGTFELVKAYQVEEHKMKEELYTITPENSKTINKAFMEERRIIGVGTSVTRALESAFINDRVSEGTRWTDLFIYPGYHYKVINALITNFHLPRSTPLMLAVAFTGKDFLFKAYYEAIKEGYRFYSFGDAMFIQ